MAELGRVSGEGGGCCCPASEVAEVADAVRCRESVAAASSGDGPRRLSTMARYFCALAQPGSSSSVRMR